MVPAGGRWTTTTSLPDRTEYTSRYAGPVSGDISLRGRHPRGRATGLSPPAISTCSVTEVSTSASAPAPSPRGLHVGQPGRSRGPHRQRQGRARLPAAHSRPPLPARGGDALG